MCKTKWNSVRKSGIYGDTHSGQKCDFLRFSPKYENFHSEIELAAPFLI